MKKCYLRNVILCLLFLICSAPSWSQIDTLLFETFEGGEKPDGWTEIKVSGTSLVSWTYQRGGYEYHPDTAAFGEYNALFSWQSYNSEATKLVTPKINLYGTTKPELRFWHVQQTWTYQGQNYNDQLRVYYRIGKNGGWHQLEQYLVAVENWTLRQIPLPDSILTDSVYIAFEGTTKYGNGVCIDNVSVIETEISPRRISSVNIVQASTQYLASGTQNNPVLRIDLHVIGNSGTCNLQSISIKSKNTDDADIAASGVKLFFTADTFFTASSQLGTSQSLSGGTATFSSLNKSLSFGMNTVWATYDLSETAGEEDHVDMSLEAGSIQVNGETYPASAADPPGDRTIYKKLFFDDFETDNGWQLNNDFERDSPKGKGGVSDAFTGGSPDPTVAYSGTKVIGDDLNGLGTYPGNYELNVPYDNINYALSPAFNLKYYRDVNLSFYRWLNVYREDDAQIQLSLDNGTNWYKLYGNEMEGGTLFDDSWNLYNYTLPVSYARKNNLQVRFTLGPTTDSKSYSGWNIDNFLVIGSYVRKDVGVSSWISPSDNCGLSDAENVTVVVKNFGAETVAAPIPVSYSFDGGQTVVTENINQSIDPDDSVIYTFAQKADLSVPAVYQDVYATTVLSGDEDATNDRIDTLIYSLPYSKPPYLDDFEQTTSFWRSYGKNSTWGHGTPNGFALKGAYSGSKAWKTNLNSYYLDQDSSYLESPCFDFTGIEKPIFEFHMWRETERDHDGARLEYSIDDGTTWNIVPKDAYSYNWNWYNNTYIAALQSAGWDTSSVGWVTARQFLPAAVANQPMIKFRFHFESDDLTTFEGFAVDDVKVYEAPIDIGVCGFKDLSTACAHVNSDSLKVYVKNYGFVKVKAGEKIYVAAKVNADPVVRDTLTLASNLPVGDSVLLQFTKPVNLDNPGNYTIHAWTANESDPTFYGTVSNDSSSLNIDILPLPYVGLLDTMRSSRPDTIILQPYYDSDYDYYWFYNSSTDSILHIPGQGKYAVRVTNSRGNGCATYDTTVVEKLILDFGVDSIIHPNNTCELGIQEHVIARIRNFGTDTLAVGDTIPVGFTLDGGSVNTANKILSSRLFPGGSTTYTFQDYDLDMSNIQAYSFSVFTGYKYDSIPSNDTLKLTMNVYGYPTVDIGPDTVIYGLSYQLDAGPGFKTYLWNNGDTTQTYTATFLGKHWVQVTDIHNCPASDTAFIHLVIHDVSPVAVTQPTNSCNPPGATQLKAKFENTGTDTISSGSKIPVGYRIDAGSWINDTLTLSSPFYPGSSAIHTFSSIESFDTVGSKVIEVFSSIQGDINPANDTLSDTVSVWGNPTVHLGNDTTIKALSYLLDAGTGPNLSYLWRDGTTTQTYTVTQSGFYYVTVTDTTHGCYARDTIILQLVIDDMGVSEWVGDTAFCYSSFNGLTVKLKNYGTPPYPANKKIPVFYSLNNGEAVHDTAVLTATLPAGGTTNFAITKFSTKPSGVNNIRIYTKLNGDLRPENDTLYKTFAVNPNPTVDLGGTMDTIKYTEAPVVLHAGSNMATYLWQDNSNDSTYSANAPGWYWVRVSNEYGCEDVDSVYLHLTTTVRDFSGQPVLLKVYPNPADNMFTLEMEFTSNENVTIELMDAGSRCIESRYLKGSSRFTTRFDVTKLPAGIYFLRIYNSHLMHIEKVVIH